MADLHPFSERAAKDEAHLRILGTSDLHAHLFPFDYYTARPTDAFGLGRTASLIDRARAEATNSILLDNGDLLQGSPLGDYIALQRGVGKSRPHPMITAMNTLGYDAMAIGNHDFNYGLDFLMKSLSGATFPAICSNVMPLDSHDQGKGRHLLAPYVILDRNMKDGAGNAHGLRIGVIGFVPPQVMAWDRRHLQGRVTVCDIVDAAHHNVPKMRAEGADLVVALAHTGIGRARAVPGMENAALPLAEVAGIDAILTGHTHMVFPGSPTISGPDVDPDKGTLHGKPCAQAGAWGSHLGVIDLLLRRDADAWEVGAFESQARPIAARQTNGQSLATVTDHREVLASVARDHEETIRYMNQPVGQTRVALHSYFALVANDPSLRVVLDAQKDFAKQLLEGTEFAGLPLLSAAAPFRAGGRGGAKAFTDVPKGPLAVRNIADLYIYPNTLSVVKVTGRILRDWLERAAGAFNQLTEGAHDQPLLNPNFPSYNFDVIDGLRYVIDPGQPSRFCPLGRLQDPQARRITGLTFAGRPIEDDMEFALVTNNFRAGGGGSFPGTGGDTSILEAPIPNRETILHHIRNSGTLKPRSDPIWSFAPMPGTSATFETGPGALNHIAQVTGVDIRHIGPGADGFVRFQINF